jgi:hypothetical protein
MREPNQDLLNATKRIRPDFEAGRYQAVLDAAAIIAKHLPTDLIPTDQARITLENLNLGTRAAGRLRLTCIGPAFLREAQSFADRYPEEAKTQLHLSYQTILGHLDLQNFNDAQKLLGRKNTFHHVGASHKVQRDLLLGATQIGLYNEVNGYRLLRRALRSWTPTRSPNPLLLEYVIQSADQLAASELHHLARSLYRSVIKILDRLDNTHLSAELKAQLLTRTHAASAYSFTVCGLGERARISSRHADHDIPLADLNPFARLHCLLTNDSQASRLEGMLEALDSARAAFNIIGEGLRVPLESEIATRCAYVQHMLDRCRLMRDFAIAAEVFTDPKEKEVFQSRFEKRIVGSEAIQLALRDTRAASTRSGNFLFGYVQKLVSLYKDQFTDIDDLLRQATHLSPFQRKILTESLSACQAFFDRLFASNKDFSSLFKSKDDRYNFLTRCARSLNNHGLRQEAAELAYAAKAACSKGALSIDAEFELIIADRWGAKTPDIPLSFRTLIDNVQSASPCSRAQRTDLLVKIVFQISALAEWDDEGEETQEDEEYALHALAASYNDDIQQRLVTNVRTIFEWVKTCRQGMLPSATLTDAVATAFRELPGDFIMPDSLWSETVGALNVMACDPRARTALPKIFRSLESHLKRECCTPSQQTCLGSTFRLAQLIVARGRIFPIDSPHFPSQEQAEFARTHLSREVSADLYTGIMRILADAANARQDYRTMLEHCIQVFATANTFSLYASSDKYHCSKLVGETLFKIVPRLLERDQKARPTATSIARRLQIISDNREILAWFVRPSDLPIDVISKSADAICRDPKRIISTHHKLNRFARNLLIGPVAALLESGTIEDDGVIRHDRLFRKCVQLCR